ncbi:MAG: cytidylate kinase-like family protein [Gemmatimonadales bacterium]
MLITISREVGAQGSVLAGLVATRLGWQLIDNEVIEEVARRAGLTPADVAQREERGPTFAERLARALVAATPEVLAPMDIDAPEAEEARLVRITEQVVADACAATNVVMVGRAAVAVIGRRDGALHVKVVASPDHRAAIIAQRDGVSREDAARRVRNNDAHRARYHRQWYDRDWHDPHNYHLVVNTEWLGLDRAVDLIVGAVRS